MEEQRERARIGRRDRARLRGRPRRGASRSPPARRRSRFVGYEKLRAETSLLGAPKPTTAGCWRSSRRAPSTPRAAARSPTPGVVALGRRRGEGRRRLPGRRRPGGGAGGRARRARPRRDAGRGRGRPRRPPRDDAQPHRDPPAARGAARAARHPRAPGGLGGAPRQAALRLHPRRAAVAGGGARRRGPRQRVDQGEPPGARDPDVARARPRSSARWRCSARSTATGCAWSRSRTSRASSAAAPTSRTPPRSASSRSPPRARAPPTCAGSRR